jgi:hypothetical protein
VRAFDGVEISARGRGDAGFVEHAAAEADGVVRETRDVGVDVERPVDRVHLGQSDARQFVEQQRAVARVAGLDGVEFVGRPKTRQRGHLREVGRRDVEVLGERSIGRTSRSGTTIQPTRQPVMQ